LAFGEKGQDERKEKCIKRKLPLHDSAPMPKEKKPFVADMAYPVQQPVRMPFEGMAPLTSSLC
jgi:hypothetical protein